MRRRLPLVAGALFLAVSALGCEGPVGPPGPAGPQGAAGPQGPAGPAGQQASLNCTQCHADDTELFAKQVQYQNSTHYNGGNFERSTEDCAICHTHEGFLERLETGATSTAAPIDDPTPVNCRTCHEIHETYTATDYTLRATANFELMTGGVADFDDGNLCAQCHQARPLDPAQTPVIDGPPVTFTSSRYGYHHGPQGNILGGTGGFEFAGSMTIETGTGAHGAGGGCPQCHMAQPFGSQAGGHTWSLAYLYHGSVEHLVDGCQDCHAESLDDFDFHHVQTQVQAKLDSLQVLLRKIGVMSKTSESMVPGTWPANVAAAAVNFQMTNEDRSLGVHNPGYVLPLLQNTIEKMAPIAAAAPGG